MVSRNDKIAIGVGVAAAGAIGVAAILLVRGAPCTPPPGGCPTGQHFDYTACACVPDTGQPVLTATPTTIMQGQQASFNVTGGSFVSYLFDFGDGQSTTTSVASASHVYNNSGSFTATVTTTDSLGTHASATTQITVTPIITGTVSTILSCNNSPSTQTQHLPVTVSGTLTRTDLGTGVPNEPVTIESSPNLSTWTPVLQTTTDANGNYAGAIIFDVAGTFYIRTSFAGGPVV